ncbi:hypothetical protein [Desulfomarina sp.]
MICRKTGMAGLYGRAIYAQWVQKGNENPDCGNLTRGRVFSEKQS